MKTSIANIAILSCALCNSVQAADDIAMSHSLVSATTLDTGIQLTYHLTLSNVGFSEYGHIYLEPAGYEFSQPQSHSRIRLSSIPGNSSLDLTWVVNSNRDKALYESGMPLFFNIYAVANGQHITQIAYSSEK